MSQIEEATKRAWKDTFNFKWVIGQTVQALKIYLSHRLTFNKKVTITNKPTINDQSNDTPNAC